MASSLRAPAGGWFCRTRPRSSSATISRCPSWSPPLPHVRTRAPVADPCSRLIWVSAPTTSFPTSCSRSDVGRIPVGRAPPPSSFMSTARTSPSLSHLRYAPRPASSSPIWSVLPGSSLLAKTCAKARLHLVPLPTFTTTCLPPFGLCSPKTIRRAGGPGGGATSRISIARCDRGAHFALSSRTSSPGPRTGGGSWRPRWSCTLARPRTVSSLRVAESSPPIGWSRVASSIRMVYDLLTAAAWCCSPARVFTAMSLARLVAGSIVPHPPRSSGSSTTSIAAERWAVSGVGASRRARNDARAATTRAVSNTSGPGGWATHISFTRWYNTPAAASVVTGKFGWMDAVLLSNAIAVLRATASCSSQNRSGPPPPPPRALRWAPR